MMFSFKKSLIFTIAMLFTLSLFAQEKEQLDTEVIDVVKPYSPTISDAFKIKDTPNVSDVDSLQKKEVRYEIFSVPVASKYTPSKGAAATVEKTEPLKLFDNYATLGFGSYTSVLGELSSTFEISRTDNAGIFLRHNSSRGGIDNLQIENKFFDTQFSGSYSSRQKELFFNLNTEIEHQVYNWYGLNSLFDALPLESINAIDAQQTYLGFNLGGDVSFEASIVEGTSARLFYLGDAYNSSEINLFLQPKFSFPLNTFDLKIEGVLDYISGNFDRDYFNTTEINYSFLNAGVSPSLVLLEDDLTLSLGTMIVASIDSENSETDFNIYPRVNVSYNLVDEEVIAYGGIEGELYQNSYREFKNENSFVSPTLQIVPTNQLYKAFGGIKGKLTNQIGYNIRASYGKEENRPLFQLHPYKGMDLNFEGYEYGNSFGIVYDDLNTFNLFGELKVAVSNDFLLGASIDFNSFSLNTQPEAWNLPELEMTLFSNFELSEKIYGGVSLFLVGERKDVLTINTSQVVTLDAFIDANVDLGYRIDDRFSIFVKGSNLFGKNYERWQNFPVQGIQGLLGATYKFDW